MPTLQLVGGAKRIILYVKCLELHLAHSQVTITLGPSGNAEPWGWADDEADG